MGRLVPARNNGRLLPTHHRHATQRLHLHLVRRRLPLAPVRPFPRYPPLQAYPAGYLGAVAEAFADHLCAA
jgi:hypothetical protein